jgi:hypothetical protein
LIRGYDIQQLCEWQLSLARNQSIERLLAMVVIRGGGDERGIADLDIANELRIERLNHFPRRARSRDVQRIERQSAVTRVFDHPECLGQSIGITEAAKLDAGEDSVRTRHLGESRKEISGAGLITLDDSHVGSGRANGSPARQPGFITGEIDLGQQREGLAACESRHRLAEK